MFRAFFVNLKQDLRGLDTLGRCAVMFCEENAFRNLLFAFMRIKPLLKRIYSKRGDNIPKGSKLFPFIVHPYESRNNFDRLVSAVSISFPLKEWQLAMTCLLSVVSYQQNVVYGRRHS